MQNPTDSDTVCWFLWVKQPALGYVALNNLRWIGQGMQMFIFTRNRVRPTRLTWSKYLIGHWFHCRRSWLLSGHQKVTYWYDVIYCSARNSPTKMRPESNSCRLRYKSYFPSLAIRSGRPNLVAFHDSDLHRRPPAWPISRLEFLSKKLQFPEVDPGDIFAADLARWNTILRARLIFRQSCPSCTPSQFFFQIGW